MEIYCKRCHKQTKASNEKNIQIGKRRISFHVCLSCGEPYEYKSFKSIITSLYHKGSHKQKTRGIIKKGKAGFSKDTYSLYLQTNHWKDLRTKKLNSKPKCEMCKEKKAIQVHHLRYKNERGESILYKEKLTDLLSVCKECHKKAHTMD